MHLPYSRRVYAAPCGNRTSRKHPTLTSASVMLMTFLDVDTGQKIIAKSVTNIDENIIFKTIKLYLRQETKFILHFMS